MGMECPCGVLVNAVSRNNNVRFNGQMGTVEGDLTYMANVCVTTLAASTLTLHFTDTETMGGKNSFTFVANSITSVECNREGQNCEVTVTGTGIVNSVQFPFEAIFRDQVASANVDIVRSFVITGFFDQNGAAPVAQGSIIALGCEDD
ncbi:hypothetical protein AB1K89_01090 [Sporosarcina sp. 179-K 8C2 HS]|uniref:hypothetical protein n=1 Tax=Sporosarcina sp. 179-K 8C2 HS TaxID=3142387 RepID=UPI0039A1398E